jgi:FtsH-binding integral membrane protein
MDFETNTNSAIYAQESERAAFIRRTYLHVAGAILAFVALEAVLLQLPLGGVISSVLSARFGWLLVLGAFMGVSFLAQKWANSDTSVGMQYLGLGLYIVAEAIIFLPLLYVAAYYTSEHVIVSSGLITMFLFAGLTASVFISKKDLSWMGRILTIGGFVAMGIIVASMLFGFSLGLIFSAVMVIFAGAAIMYETSNVLHHYRTTQHVAASLALFASVALLFWYILRLVMGSRN